MQSPWQLQQSKRTVISSLHSKLHENRQKTVGEMAKIGRCQGGCYAITMTPA